MLLIIKGFLKPELTISMPKNANLQNKQIKSNGYFVKGNKIPTEKF